MIGKLLDHRYQVIRILAKGGFGQTYIAQDTRRPGNPICVVKHLKSASTDPKIFETAKRLFNSEAETLEKLGNHDQIPRLLAYFDENQEFFLVQEYVDGHTLSEELIPGQPWNEGQVIQMLLEVLGILEFVHQQGVIHRDIKPDNIIRRAADYRLVLVDFGAVKQLRSPLVTVGAQLTATVAIGTPGYMPTEQGQGKPRPNSDIYSLGIIAIQALTGVPAKQLQEDPNTGEILWQHFLPVNYRLAEILSKMVRYHFKDRYQTATEALQACRELMNLASGYSLPSEAPQQVIYQIPKSLPSQVFSQHTVAVAPANPVVSKSIRRESNKPDPLPLVIGILLAGGAAALVTNLYPNVKNLTANWTGNDRTLGNKCLAVVVANSNIRSEPSAINSDNILKTVGDNSQFDVTGKRTKRGWIELKLKSGRLAWAHSEVITNNDNWISCLRDQGISVQTVDDSSLITSIPVPKPQVKPIPVATSQLEISESEKTQAGQDQDKIVAQAREKFESGDLQGAIAILRSIPANAASGIKETVQIVNQWQNDWAKAEALANDINKAIDDGKWDQVLAYRDNPEKLPNIKYWQDKLEPMFKQASENAAKQVLSQEEKNSNENKPTSTQTPGATDKPASDL
ncbi:serine/threonine protein kinase [Anabaena cylindrica FACHB-243]|uniref:non-specific serine/threonine protein kinase n=1 Tax=Anabaena cylindrica (strain ATCC 27899 / PCC 7122) TaxID=272123 RepID=K9ZJU5_ANACC|nr:MULTISPECIES: serine/threonine protein kinase [Anabaena]AFZ59513.1 serine/threonine protein kinase [Anabaena cylindrica PCC 7122]MBD2418823.1 serine/threonine protein kinase [Anabaena cylindrica FACHB-243]MBY5283329.1 serine/threonine protein kinase [Anabaena sp. CCAP 1446/1C]MBY5306805.1 serine/threonine protein kinase [Anabaena sp. CCAP 1446/1C]MCM2406388.1 serine/threonine protein kinase [Anabaena sp. CCAP 1446/1C]